MNATTDFERTLATWLEREGPDSVPERVVEAALAEAQTVRQRPAWLTSTWWASRASREGEAMKPTQTIERVPTLPIIRPPLRLGWVAVAIAALLALLGGLLLVGALRNEQAPLLSECPAGTTPNEPGPVDQARPEPPREHGVWSVQSAAGDGKGAIYAASSDGTWRFNVCSNTWQRVAPDAPPGLADFWTPEGAGLVYDVDSDALLAFAPASVWSFDPPAGEWTLRDEDAPAYYRAVYDRVTGLVVVLGGRTMWTYDVDTGTWREIDQGTLVPPDLRYDGIALVAYHTSADRVVLYRRLRQHLVEDWAATWTFDLRARSWTRSDSEMPSFYAADHLFKQIVYDESNRRTVIFGDTTIAAYDAAADEWEIVDAEGAGRGVGFRGGRAAAYDPLNHRIVVFGGGWASEGRSVDDVVALDLRTRTWIELLAPSE
jgi:hypothetical protein